MNRLYTLKWGWVLALYCFLDLFCAGMGMGVPIFNILFGFVAGWYVARRIVARRTFPASTALQDILKRVLIYAMIASAFTFLVMAVIWGPMVPMLFDPSINLENTGIPLILYEPRASFIGWLVLMIAISPFLQFLMTLLGAHLTLLRWPPRIERSRAFHSARVDYKYQRYAVWKPRLRSRAFLNRVFHSALAPENQ